MNASQAKDFDANFRVDTDTRHQPPLHEPPHLAIQILSVIALGVVSIIAVSMAFDATWVAGIAVIAILFPLWMKSPAFSPRPRTNKADPRVSEILPRSDQPKPSGNASFDAYRAQLLDRLEQENRDFQAFLERLRASRDKSEFDQFMTDRAERARDLTPPRPASDRTELTGY